MKNFLALLLFISFSFLPDTMFGGQPATLHFDLNACEAYAFNGTNMDYSEFTAVSNNTSEVSLDVVGNNMYRTNATNNKHSCTPGVNGTEGMCVSYDMDCNYRAGNERSIKFDILVSTTGAGPANLNDLQFYEKAPLMFDWTDGPSGNNNYPTFYGVRILRDGVVIFEQSGIATSNDWTLQSYDFSGLSGFTVEDVAMFNIELLAYCPVGTFAMQSVWDIDEVTFTASCPSNSICVDGNGNTIAIDGGTVNLANGGTTLSGCVGDIVFDVENTSTANLASYYYIITDNNDNILAFVDATVTSNLDLSGAPTGECHIWGWSQIEQADPIPGENISTLNDDVCEQISNNYITIFRAEPLGGVLLGGPFEFCVGDGIADNIPAGSVMLSNNSGANSQWVVTDDQGIILGLPPMPSAVDFDGAGVGTCLVWHLSFENGLTGAVVGNNAMMDLMGCFSLSNPISVNRVDCTDAIVGGTLEGGPFEFCVGDSIVDNVSGITLTGNTGMNNQWVITDDQGNILGLPPMPGAVDFDGAGAGVCLIWNLSFDGALTGLDVGNNVSVVTGDFALSNSISVTRNQPEGGLITGGPFEFCVGDGVADNIAAGSITLAGNSGTNSQWVVTDDQGNILGLPPMPSAVDFDGAGVGTCLVWHLSFENGLTGVIVGNNAMTDLVGCYSLSNSISVNRVDCTNTIAGGTLEGGPFEFCVGDSIADNVSGITLTGNTGMNNQWVVTDSQGIILGLPPMPGVVDFDGAGAGVCLIWNLSFDGALTGLDVGNNISIVTGDFALSNSISVTRNQPEGGMIEGGPFEFCVGDGVADNIAVGSITLAGNSGTNSQWVVTDDQGNILGLPPMPSAVDFDGAGVGTCLVWHLSFENGLTGAVVGNNAMTDLVGCYSLSNSIPVTRNQPEGGMIEGGPFEFCVGDGVADTIAVGSITIAGNSGTNSQWVVTDDQGIILGLPPMPSAVNFDGAGAGTCLIWHLSFDGTLSGAEVGNNAMTDLVGCYSISNSISVTRNQPIGGTLTGGPFEFCVGDGVADNVSGVMLTGNSGANSQFIVTDDQGIILGLPPTPDAVDFDGAGLGSCLIWHLSFDGTLTGAEVGNNAMTDLVGCYNLSNPVTVNRIDCIGTLGGTIEGGPFEFCVGDGIADNVSGITLTGNNGLENQWVVTDDQGNILGLPPMPGAVDFDGAGPGVCLIWNLSFNGTLTGVVVGNNISGVTGDFALSNSIAVTRNQPEGGIISGGPFEFCVGDSIIDIIAPGSISLVDNSGSNSQWVITDDQGIILGLPPMPSAVDFDGAGVGTCLIWHLSFADGLTGAEVGNNAVTDLVGCFSLSNSIPVNRIDCGTGVNGGTLAGGPFEFCVGDGEEDNVSGITLTDNSGPNNQWVVTDDQGIILGLPPMPGVVNFDDAGPGVCLIWNLAYVTGIVGLDVGSALSNLAGNFALSNSIAVVRNQTEGGSLYGGPFTFCVGDGVADTLAANAITLSGNSGPNSQWLVTDSLGNILGLPLTPSAVDFDSAGVATCLIWHLSFASGLIGAEIGNNAMTDLVGCYNLSNAITVDRIDCTNSINGGNLGGGPFEFCVGDGIVDNVSGITLDNTSTTENQWVITDEQGNILGLPSMPSVVDFDGAGAGVCLIWNVSLQGGISGLVVGNNVSDIVGDHDFSNSISVTRNQSEGGTLYGGPFTFCVGDGVADNLASNAITLTGNSGENSQWVVTDEQGNILGLPPTPEAVDFDGAGVATCLIWHLSFADGLTGAEIGNNAMTDLEGCYSLSNSVSVNRIDCSGAINGGNLAGGPFEFCVGDSIPDNVSGITLDNNSGVNNQWVVTDNLGNILGLPSMPGVVDFDGAGAGVCLIWNVSFNGALTGLEVGNNVSIVTGDFAWSNAISVTRNQPESGILVGGPFEFCVGDGLADNILVGEIVLSGNSGANSQWVVTDNLGNILGLPPTPEAVDFEVAGLGSCLVWHLSFADGLTGVEVGNNAMTDLQGCYSLSNPLTVNRITCGTLSQDSIVINEFGLDNKVEIKNVGNTTIDVSSYWLCTFPSYNQLSTLTMDCGSDLILEPGELVTLVVNFGVTGTDGELGLYTTNNFGSSNAIIDYVEWGSTGHTRSTVAVSAGIWSTGDFATPLASGLVYEYDGIGNTSSDWTQDAATPCLENTFAPLPNVSKLVFSIFPNPTIDNLIINFESVTSDKGLIFIYDRMGSLLQKETIDFTVKSRTDINISDLPTGTYFVKVISKSRYETKRFVKVN